MSTTVEKVMNACTFTLSTMLMHKPDQTCGGGGAYQLAECLEKLTINDLM